MERKDGKCSANRISLIHLVAKSFHVPVGISFRHRYATDVVCSLSTVKLLSLLYNVCNLLVIVLEKILVATTSRGRNVSELVFDCAEEFEVWFEILVDVAD